MSHLTQALRAATAVALAGSAVFAGIATATADPPTTASPADINTLAASVSKGYGLNNCQPGQSTGVVLAELDCGQNPDPNGPAAGIYQLFGNGSDMAASFTSRIKDVTVSACGESGQSPGTWHQGATGQAAGQVACGTSQNAATITWTTDGKNVLSQIRGSNTDVDALYQWWRTNG